MDNWFRFTARGRFRIAPGPDWQWPAVPAAADLASPDLPVPGWPTAEYTAMRDAVNKELLRGGPTLNYTDPLEGQRSLVVRDVRVELPTGTDESGTAVTAGAVVFETACFNPVRNMGAGARLGEWLAWVRVSPGQGRAAFQLLSLDAVSCARVDDGTAGLSACAMTGERLFVREDSAPAS